MTTFVKCSVTTFLFAALVSGGCGPKPVASTAPESVAAPEEPKFVIGSFEAMEEAAPDRKLPFVLDAGKQQVEAPCFEKVKRPAEWQTSSPDVARMIDENREAVTAAILAWYKKELYPKPMWGVDVTGWEVVIEKPVIRHVSTEKLSLAADQTCITDTARALPTDVRAVTTLFGATVFKFKSNTPLDKGRVKSMKQAAKKQKIRFVPVNAYTPAMDANGKQRKNEKKEKLFNSPTGDLLTKKALPPAPKRLTVEWKIILPKPVYFATGDLPADSWRREQLPDACDVYLVFDDVVPQVPKCAQFQRAGFGARQAKDPANIIIKVAAYDTTYTEEIPFGAPSMVRAGGQMLVWVTPQKIEEGAHLLIDSLVLQTGKATFEEKTFPPAEKKKKKR